MNNLNRLMNNNGFTIIELMIIVAIIAVLAAMAIGMYRPFINRTVCSQVEVTVHEAMVQAVKQLNETGSFTVGGTQASTLGINYPDKVASVTIYWNGSNFTVNGTAVGNKCPKGTRYVLQEGETTGTWK